MSPPEVFAYRALAEAEQAAAAAGKLVLIDFTAVWCGPCQGMEKTTWRDARVTKWIAEHACAVQVDIDHQQEVASRFGVQAVPTVVALRDGAELDRFVGAKNAVDALRWMEDALAGRHEADRLREVAASAGPVARMQLAGHLLMTGKYPEALLEHVWLWKHGVEADPGFVGVRSSYLAMQLEELAADHPPARAELERLRDEAEATAPEDWLTLNRVLHDDARSLAWFDRIKDAPPPGVRWGMLEFLLGEALERRGSWADLARLHPDPLATLASRHGQGAELAAAIERGEVPGEAREFQEQMAESFRAYAAKLAQIFMAAGRAEEAARIAARARELDPSDAMANALSSSPSDRG